MSARAIAATLLLLCSGALSSSYAAVPIRFSGEIGGLVTDSAGKLQTGAVVLLFNKQDHLLQKSSTDAAGSFTFTDLLPDFYSVQASLTSFVPAMKERILVKPGMRSLLSVNLSRVFSSVQLVSIAPLPGGLMSDNWKWTLRTDNDVRPVLHILPGPRADAPAAEREAVFSGSRGLIRISASDEVSGAGEADLGTQFAFATSVYGGNRFGVAGNVGYASVSGAPSAAIRTSYSHNFAGAEPTLAVTMRQFYVPMRIGQTLTGSPDSTLPALRTLGVSLDDKTQLTDSTNLEYGFELDTVSFLDHLQYFSPYAKLSHALSHGALDFTWTSGNSRPGLGVSNTDPGGDLQRDLTDLALLPRVTLSEGHAKVQRGEDYEIGLSQRFGTREYRVYGYYDDISNTTLTIANPQGNLFPGDLLPDLFSNSALFNAGRFEMFGYATSVTQDLGDHYKVTLIYGSPGVIAPRSTEIPGTSAQDLRDLFGMTHRQALTMRVTGTIKCTGTGFVTSYEWTDYRSAMPGPIFTTDSARPEPGLNVVIRQPIPSIPGMHGRVEASAELRNLLAQGYLPLTLPGGQQLLMVNTPRSIRGGLAFVF
jgi:hypothetical protein